MLAVVKDFSQKGVSLQEAPRPEFSPYEVLIRVKAVGICGSDVRIFNEVIPGRKKIIIGHELSGEIADLGEKVHSFKKGDRVATAICIGCAICRYCRKGYFNLCDKLEEVGSHHRWGDGGICIRSRPKRSPNSGSCFFRRSNPG